MMAAGNYRSDTKKKKNKNYTDYDFDDVYYKL